MRKTIVLISVFLTFYNFSEIVGQLSDSIEYLNSDSTVAIYPDSIIDRMYWYDHKELGLKIRLEYPTPIEGDLIKDEKKDGPNTQATQPKENHNPLR